MVLDLVTIIQSKNTQHPGKKTLVGLEALLMTLLWKHHEKGQLKNKRYPVCDDLEMDQFSRLCSFIRHSHSKSVNQRGDRQTERHGSGLSVYAVTVHSMVIRENKSKVQEAKTKSNQLVSLVPQYTVSGKGKCQQSQSLWDIQAKHGTVRDMNCPGSYTLSA